MLHRDGLVSVRHDALLASICLDRPELAAIRFKVPASPTLFMDEARR